ncbi:MAG: hydroxymethylglutaryl-CoA lyase [Chloroflexia bacterium]|jgi:isopropylmalate/homocitrate/citramalate synthase|nr:hydroxymethylglutaryl-CoA lyase [Chloroflexia bacterium]
MSAVPSLPRRVTVYEVGPRDGLQNEKGQVSTADKVRYIDLLTAAGYSYIEATSFVSSRAVPQLSDAPEVLAAINRGASVHYPVLVPNEKGMLRALEAGVTDAAVFTAASESFTKANINATIAESLANFRPVMALAAQNNVTVRGYVSTAFGCPYEGAVPTQKVREVALALLELGVTQVSIGDTIGVGTPNQVYEVMGLLLRDIPAEQLAVHFHDTRGTALANVLAALEMGITTIDSSSAGLGGCPYAPGASGNLATEDLLYMLNGLGIETGVDLEKVVEASRFITSVLNKPPASRYLQAYLAQCAA